MSLGVDGFELLVAELARLRRAIRVAIDKPIELEINFLRDIFGVIKVLFRSGQSRFRSRRRKRLGQHHGKGGPMRIVTKLLWVTQMSSRFFRSFLGGIGEGLFHLWGKPAGADVEAAGFVAALLKDLRGGDVAGDFLVVGAYPEPQMADGMFDILDVLHDALVRQGDERQVLAKLPGADRSGVSCRQILIGIQNGEHLFCRILVEASGSIGNPFERIARWRL